MVLAQAGNSDAGKKRQVFAIHFSHDCNSVLLSVRPSKEPRAH